MGGAVKYKCLDISISFKTSKEGWGSLESYVWVYVREGGLTLKRLGGGQFDSPPPPVAFWKLYLLKRGYNPGFLWLLKLS